MCDRYFNFICVYVITHLETFNLIRHSMLTAETEGVSATDGEMLVEINFYLRV